VPEIHSAPVGVRGNVVAGDEELEQIASFLDVLDGQDLVQYRVSPGFLEGLMWRLPCE
jgi:hypothetical protein